ncbi:MAG: TSUP family transporter [Clostridia bacterium]|nr:TSUP family transporter [Clostridia bacterium]
MFLGIIPYSKVLLVCIGTFAAGFVDAIAGGGGIISLPVYLLTGLPAQTAFGTNKVSSTLGATVSAARFIRGGKVKWLSAIPSAITGLLGARMASTFVMSMSPETFQKIIICILPFTAVFLIFKKDFGETENQMEFSTAKVVILSLLIGLAVGFYDGLVGPGTGTFAILAFTSILKFDLKNASGTAKIFNWASNLGSALLFISAGVVIWPMCLMSAACNMTGSYIGSGLAIKKDPKFIRITMTIVCSMLIIKLAYDVFF